MHHDNVLDFFRATSLCRQPAALCQLYHNGRAWPMADQSIRHLEFGDHIRLQVRSSGPTWCELEHSEWIDRSRKVFASSSDEESGTQPESQQPVRSETLSTPRASRSRSRGRRGNENYADGSESTSLLQVAARMTRQRGILHDVTNVQGGDSLKCH